MAKKISTNKTGTKNSSQPHKLCECGNPVKSRWVSFLERTVEDDKCESCAEKQRVEQARQSLRQTRMAKAARMRQLLSKAIPALFKNAHLRDLSNAFRRAMLDYDLNIGLVLFGPVGRGKSYALSALARHLIFKRKQVRRITYEMLCLQIRDTYKQGSKKTELDVIRPLIDCDCLIIEDVGSTTSIGKDESDFSIRTFFVLLDSRLEACRPTFISTNKSRKNLTASFDERIASRLSLFKWIGAGGNDKRQKGE